MKLGIKNSAGECLVHESDSRVDRTSFRFEVFCKVCGAIGIRIELEKIPLERRGAESFLAHIHANISSGSGATWTNCWLRAILARINAGGAL